MDDNKDRFCIIHKETVQTDQDERLISPQSYDSWRTLLEAAKVRNFDPLLEVAKNVREGKVPAIFYHRRCRSMFTMKRGLESLQRRDEDPIEDDVAHPQTKRRSTSSNSRVYDEECIFCGKEKYVHSTNSREKLVKATQLRVDQTLREKALSKCDQKILAVTTRDIVAAEAHYHRSCYREYTQPDKTPPVQVGSSVDANQDERDAEQGAFSDLFQYIKAEVVDKQVVVSMTDLARKLESFIQSRGVDKLNESTKKHIRRKIEAEFGSALEIFPNDNGKLLIISKNLNHQETVKVNVALKKELEILKSKSTDVKQVIDQCSAYIRRAILDTKWKTPWPIHPCDLNGEPFPVPEYLSRLLMGLLTSDPDIINPSYRVMTLVGSFSQDIIYATTCG